jgi:2-methylcitrate dehydratase PrpD
MQEARYNMKGLTQELADFVAGTEYEDLPDSVVHEAKRVLLDSFGCALAGLGSRKGSISVDLAKRLGGPSESTIIGTGIKASCTSVAFANGELINALDFDAMLQPAIHVAPFVLPPAVALGESRSTLGKEIILAAVLGHELSARVACGLSREFTAVKGSSEVLWPLVHGYSCNVFGSVASAGKVMKLDGKKMVNAIGLAGYLAPMQASVQWQRSGTASLVKYASPGWIAQTGITAALLAEMGYWGDASVLEGGHGFWRFAGSETWEPEAVTKNLGQEWYILKTSYKPYPCCGIMRGALDAFRSIIEDNSLIAEEIEQVKVWLHPLCEMPLWQNCEIDTEVEAQFSVAYVFALIANRIRPGPKWQNPSTMKKSKIREFMGKVSSSTHPDYSRAVIENRSPPRGRVDVIANGRTYSQERQYAIGEATPPEARLSDNALLEKFRVNALHVLRIKQIKEAADSIFRIEDVDDISSLMKMMAPQNA